MPVGAGCPCRAAAITYLLISGARRREPGRTATQAREPIAMPTTDPSLRGQAAGLLTRVLLPLALLAALAAPAPATAADPGHAEPGSQKHRVGGEGNLKLPDLNSVSFLGGSIGGKTLLISGLVISIIGLLMVSRAKAKLRTNKGLQVWI